MRNKVTIGLGGNLGDVKKTLLETIELISTKIGKIHSTSSVYQTQAWGVEDQPSFLNQVVVAETALTPLEVLDCCLEIEQELGRDRINGTKWGERVIDVDVLFYASLLIDLPTLKVPHPHIQDRNFVLVPLMEIAPDFVHPQLKKTPQELKEVSTDKMTVIKLLD